MSWQKSFQTVLDVAVQSHARSSKQIKYAICDLSALDPNLHNQLFHTRTSRLAVVGHCCEGFACPFVRTCPLTAASFIPTSTLSPDPQTVSQQY